LFAYGKILQPQLKSEHCPSMSKPPGAKNQARLPSSNISLDTHGPWIPYNFGGYTENTPLFGAKTWYLGSQKGSLTQPATVTLAAAVPFKRPRLDLVHDAPTKIHNGPLKCFVKCFGKGASISSICWCPDTVHTSAFQWCFPHNAKSLRTLFRRPNLRWNLWWNLFGWIWSLRNIPENKTYSLMNTLKNHQKKLDCTNASTESWLQSHPFRKLVHQVENAHIYIYMHIYTHWYMHLSYKYACSMQT